MLKNKISYVPVILAVLTALCLLTAAQQNPDKSSIGHRFHKQTSLKAQGLFTDQPKPPKPPEYKKYTKAEKFDLPNPDFHGIFVEKAIRNRRSVRNYSDKPLTLAQLSQLLFAAQGVTGHAHGRNLRAAPSAGALYPFELYAVVNNVKNLSPGLYHYSVPDHCLHLLRKGDLRKSIVNAALNQQTVGRAAVTFVLSAVFDRTRAKYAERGFRYVYIETGHISENIYLQAESMKLGSVCIGAFFDEKLNDLIGVDGRREAAICLHAVGAL